MILLPADTIQINQKKVDKIDKIMKSVLRLVVFSRFHTANDVLNAYLASIMNMKQLVAIKNAQMEGQNEEEIAQYHKNLQESLEFVAEEINQQNDFETEVQLFQLLRIISPETNLLHPNKYRQTQVVVGNHICCEPYLIPSLMSELFYQLQTISNPIIRAIYLHHEMIRIHPFADGNGRVTRIAKNWVLMFDLYPPIFIDEVKQKKAYIDLLSNSFAELQRNPAAWNEHITLFFEQQLDIILESTSLLLDEIDEKGLKRLNQRTHSPTF